MSKFWLSDFSWENGTVLVKKTGHKVRLDASVLQDIAAWMSFYTLAEGWRLWRMLSGHRRPRIAFLPDAPRPWYFVWPVIHVAGSIIEKDPMRADVVFQFDDSTTTSRFSKSDFPHAKCINFECADVSKTAIAEAFERAAGYELSVDPTVYQGPMVEKSEINGAHDGRIIEGPQDAEPGRTYQRLIDNTIDGGLVEDLRCTCVDGKPVLVLHKRRQVSRRFLNENAEVLLGDPNTVFTNEELGIIQRFTAEIGLDWGGIDVLRDNASGKIFIVDANKTDMGPPIALPLGLKLRATRRMAHAFAAAYAP